MMKRSVGALAVLLFVCLVGTHVQATPVDLSMFTPDPGVAVNDGVVAFTENTSATIYLYNDAFLVPDDASILTFDYSLQSSQLGQIDNYLTFELDFVPVLTFSTIGSDHFQIDLTSYRGTKISLAWGLIWDGSETDLGEATAQISNVDLATTSVPEPSTLLLLGSGLAGLIGFSQRRKSLRS